MEQREVRLLNHSCPHATASQFSRFATESATLFFTGTDAASDSACEETKKPIKKRPLQDMRESTFLLEQECRFEHMINAFEGLHALDVDPEVETFTNGLAYSLNKTSGFQCAKLFKEINDLVYDTMFPKHTTAPRPPKHHIHLQMLNPTWGHSGPPIQCLPLLLLQFMVTLLLSRTGECMSTHQLIPPGL